jgi:hypothetical protein
MRLSSVILGVFLLAGCSQPVFDEPEVKDEALFGPTAMRIHPVFTQVKDWNGDSRPDGIEVLLEFQDQFGDPTKAAGTIMFELYPYRQGDPDPRGPRVVNPWHGSLLTTREQISRWNRTSRTYSFELSFPGVDVRKPYVLTAVFRSGSGNRFFDRIVLDVQEPAVAPATKPGSQPSVNAQP